MPLNLATVQTVFGLFQIFLRLADQGLLTLERLKAIAAEAGATPEELADLDQRLSAAIARRQADLGGDDTLGD